MSKHRFLFVGLVVVLASFILIPPVFAQQTSPVDNPLVSLPGSIRDTGIHFAVTDSYYLNVTIDSTEIVNLGLESVPQMVTLKFTPVSSATSTQIAISGLTPSTTYYKYEDSYHNLDQFTTDIDGSYTYTQDISISHLVFIQPTHSTKFINSGATGGDCSLIGNWDPSTSTCTLTADLNETVEIDSSNITLDGGHHTITGTNTGSGVYLHGGYPNYLTGVTVKNLTVNGFTYGVLVDWVSNSTITNVTSKVNTYGLYGIGFSNFDTISDSTFSQNRFVGIELEGYNSSNTITNNVISSNGFLGVYLFLQSNSTVISRNTISNSVIGLQIYNSGNNQVYNNNFINNSVGHQAEVDAIGCDGMPSMYVGGHIFWGPSGCTGNVFNLDRPVGGNYWSDYDTSQPQVCTDTNNDGFCDVAYVIFPRFPQYSGYDFLPWTRQDGWKPNQPPTITDLGQFKSSGLIQDQIPVGGITMESSVSDPTKSIVMFKATVSDPESDQIKLQIEVKPLTVTFNEQNVSESGFTASGSHISVTKDNLDNGQYHWRARAVDNNGKTSDWQEFGTPGNFNFEVKLVPLYTQVSSIFPSLLETQTWSKATDKYGSGNYPDCIDRDSGISSIRRCGCAIASSVMLLRYHGVANGVDNMDINPLNIDSWFTMNSGYTADGDVIWPQVTKYAKGKVKFDGVAGENIPILDDYLAAGDPVILYQASIGHFLVADGKLGATYTIKDPRWFNTNYLAQTSTYPFTRNYNNGFSSLRLFSPVIGQNIVPDGIYISIASPAELLITDPQGRRLGRDPLTGISFNEINRGSYYQEGISAATDDPLSPHESKVLLIPTPTQGEYSLQVIGTGTGIYSLDSLLYDVQGDAHERSFVGTTETGTVTDFGITFTPSQPANMTVKPTDKIPPEAKIYFDPDVKQLKVEGVDNIIRPAPSVERRDKIYLITDAAGNITELIFGKIKQEDKEIKAELKSLQYNAEPIIKLPGTELKFEWSVDNRTSQVKELEQKIEVKDQFEIKAKYSYKKNETEIKIKKGGDENTQETTQKLPGLITVKLTTKSGKLSFEF